MCVCVCVCGYLRGLSESKVSVGKGIEKSVIITYYLIHTPELRGAVMHQKAGLPPP